MSHRHTSRALTFTIKRIAVEPGFAGVFRISGHQNEVRRSLTLRASATPARCPTAWPSPSSRTLIALPFVGCSSCRHE